MQRKWKWHNNLKTTKERCAKKKGANLPRVQNNYEKDRPRGQICPLAEKEVFHNMGVLVSRFYTPYGHSAKYSAVVALHTSHTLTHFS